MVPGGMRGSEGCAPLGVQGGPPLSAKLVSMHSVMIKRFPCFDGVKQFPLYSGFVRNPLIC